MRSDCEGLVGARAEVERHQSASGVHEGRLDRSKRRCQKRSRKAALVDAKSRIAREPAKRSRKEEEIEKEGSQGNPMVLAGRCSLSLLPTCNRGGEELELVGESRTRSTAGKEDEKVGFKTRRMIKQTKQPVSRTRSRRTNHRSSNVLAFGLALSALVVFNLVLQLPTETRALKLPSFLSWAQPQSHHTSATTATATLANGSPTLAPSVATSSAQQLQPAGATTKQFNLAQMAADEPLLASSSVFDAIKAAHSNQQESIAAAMGSSQQQTTAPTAGGHLGAISALRKPFQSILTLPSKHHQIHLFSGLPKSLFGRLLTSGSSTSSSSVTSNAAGATSGPATRPVQVSGVGGIVAAWPQPQQPQRPLRMPIFPRQPNFMHESAVFNQAAFEQQRQPKKHALGYGENDDFMIIDPSSGPQQPQIEQQLALAGEHSQQMQQQPQQAHKPPSEEFHDLPAGILGDQEAVEQQQVTAAATSNITSKSLSDGSAQRSTNKLPQEMDQLQAIKTISNSNNSSLGEESAFSAAANESSSENLSSSSDGYFPSVGDLTRLALVNESSKEAAAAASTALESAERSLLSSEFLADNSTASTNGGNSNSASVGAGSSIDDVIKAAELELAAAEAFANKANETFPSMRQLGHQEDQLQANNRGNSSRQLQQQGRQYQRGMAGSMENPLESGGLESASSAIVVSPSESLPPTRPTTNHQQHQSSLSGARLAGQQSAPMQAAHFGAQEMESFILGPFKGLHSVAAGSFENNQRQPATLLSSEPAFAAEQAMLQALNQFSMEQQQQQQQQPLGGSMSPSAQSQRQQHQRGLGIRAGMASNLLQQAKSLIQLPFAVHTLAGPQQSSPNPSRALLSLQQQAHSHHQQLASQASIVSPQTQQQPPFAYNNANRLQPSDNNWHQQRMPWPPQSATLRHPQQQQAPRWPPPAGPFQSAASLEPIHVPPQPQRAYLRPAAVPQQRQPASGNSYFHLGSPARRPPPQQQQHHQQQLQLGAGRENVPAYFVDHLAHQMNREAQQSQQLQQLQQSSLPYSPFAQQQQHLAPPTDDNAASGNLGNLYSHLTEPTVITPTIREGHPLNSIADQLRQQQRQLSSYQLIVDHGNPDREQPLRQQQQQQGHFEQQSAESPLMSFQSTRVAQAQQQRDQQQQQQQQLIGKVRTQHQQHQASKFKSGLYQIDAPSLTQHQQQAQAAADEAGGAAELQQHQVGDSELGDDEPREQQQAAPAQENSKQQQLANDSSNEEEDENGEHESGDDQQSPAVLEQQSQPNAPPGGAGGFVRQVGASIGVANNRSTSGGRLLSSPVAVKGQVFNEPVSSVVDEKADWRGDASTTAAASGGQLQAAPGASEPASGQSLSQVQALKLSQDIMLYDFEVPHSPTAQAQRLISESSPEQGQQEPRRPMSLLDTQVYSVPAYQIEPSGGYSGRISQRRRPQFSNSPAAANFRYQSSQQPAPRVAGFLGQQRPQPQIGQFPLPYLAPPSAAQVMQQQPQSTYPAELSNEANQQQAFAATRPQFYQTRPRAQSMLQPAGDWTERQQEQQLANNQHFFQYQPVAASTANQQQVAQAVGLTGQQQQAQSAIAERPNLAEHQQQVGVNPRAPTEPASQHQYLVAIQHQAAPNGAVVFASNFLTQEQQQVQTAPDNGGSSQQQQQGVAALDSQQQQVQTPTSVAPSAAATAKESGKSSGSSSSTLTETANNSGGNSPETISVLTRDEDAELALNQGAQQQSPSQETAKSQLRQQQQQVETSSDNNESSNMQQQQQLQATTSSPSAFCADRAPGLYADESQRCKAYYQCAPTGHQMFRCNNQTQFNQKTQNCDWWYNVNCGGQLGSSADFDQALPSSLSISSERPQQAARQSPQEFQTVPALSASAAEQLEPTTSGALLLSGQDSPSVTFQGPSSIQLDAQTLNLTALEPGSSPQQLLSPQNNLAAYNQQVEAVASLQLQQQQSLREQQQEAEFAERSTTTRDPLLGQSSTTEASSPTTTDSSNNATTAIDDGSNSTTATTAQSGQAHSASAGQTSSTQISADSLGSGSTTSEFAANNANHLLPNTGSSESSISSGAQDSSGTEINRQQQPDTSNSKTGSGSSTKRLIQSEFGVGVQQPQQSLRSEGAKSARSAARFEFTRTRATGSGAELFSGNLISVKSSGGGDSTDSGNDVSDQQQQQQFDLEQQYANHQYSVGDSNSAAGGDSQRISSAQAAAIYSTSANQGSVSYMPAVAQSQPQPQLSSSLPLAAGARSGVRAASEQVAPTTTTTATTATGSESRAASNLLEPSGEQAGFSASALKAQVRRLERRFGARLMRSAKTTGSISSAQTTSLSSAAATSSTPTTTTTTTSTTSENTDNSARAPRRAQR